MDSTTIDSTEPSASAQVFRRASTHTSASDRYNPSVASINRCSRDFSFIEDALAEGDRFGDGLLLQGELVSTIEIPASAHRAFLSSPNDQPPAQHFQVVRKLGAGSYAVVYLARELLPNDQLGREYAVKCISKLGLDKEALDAQMLEATIQQALPLHPNVVTLYKTYSTNSLLLLLLEFVPGEDLFYFLEQAKDHNNSSTETLGNPSTPPTPSILASLHPSQLLSVRRLHLIASMFSQMCDAVAACHQSGVFHRDIKPENFIVTDGQQLDASGDYERRVVVKLTDFGLATRDRESYDVDCGSAPYMSFECRNSNAPSYLTAPADVWSLGIVLLNMLYHHNPWADTATGVCASFTYYRQDPIAFFMQRFPGMTIAVAKFFSNKVFCILDAANPQRITAHDFGLWARNLPRWLGPDARRDANLAFYAPIVLAPAPVPAHKKATLSEASAYAESINLANATEEVDPRRSSVSSYRDKAPPPLSTLPPLEQPTQPEVLSGGESDGEEKPASRASTDQPQKRRKRGARGKGNQAQTPTTANPTPLVTPNEPDTLSWMAERVQSKAREASNARTHSRAGSISTGAPSIAPSTTSSGAIKKKKSSNWGSIFRRDSGSDHEFVASGAVGGLEDDIFGTSSANSSGYVPAPTILAQRVGNIVMGLDPDIGAPAAASTAKDSGRSFSRGRKKNTVAPPNAIPEVEPKMKNKASLDPRRRAPSAPAPDRNTSWRARSVDRASPVPFTSSTPSTPTTPSYHYQKASQINKGMDPPPVPELPASYRPFNLASNNAMLTSGAAPTIPSASSSVSAMPPMVNITPSQSSPTTSAPINPIYGSSPAPAIKSSAASIRSVAPSVMSTSTVSTSVSSNYWGKNTRSSYFGGSKYADSVRSISTAATSVSAGSENWRERGNYKPQSNIKQMDGIPWELDQVPRGPGFHHRAAKGKGPANPDGQPPLRNKASSKKKLSDFAPLEPITEKPKTSGESPLESVDSGFHSAGFISSPQLQEVNGKASIGSKSSIWTRWRK